MKTAIPLTPVSSAKMPKYPTREQALAHPSMLCATPHRWIRHPALCAALLFTVSSGLAGCSSPGAGSYSSSTNSPQPVSTETVTEPSSAEAVESAVESGAPSIVEAPVSDQDLLDTNIPVFTHGSGRGSYGCVSVAPAVFLSEEEALQVIQEEAAAQGVTFTESKTVSGTFPATSLDPTGQPETATYDGALELDGYNSQLKIGFEFVSQLDVAEWETPNPMEASVSTYNMLDTAQRLGESAPGVAVFYDPTSDDWEEFGDVYDYDESAYVAAQKEKSLEDLRAQVRDFLQWLSAQGVI